MLLFLMFFDIYCLLFMKCFIAGPGSLAPPVSSPGVPQVPSGPMPHPMSSRGDSFHGNHSLPQYSNANLSHYPRSEFSCLIV